MGCKEWQGTRDKDGYGVVKTAKDRDKRAHRVAWEQAHGPIPKGMLVLHRCDNPPCVNVDHLFLGTNADNMADKVRKGRHRYGKETVFKKGERRPRKLTVDQVDAIHELYEDGLSQVEIARYFNVSQPLVSQILRGAAWKDRVKPKPTF